MWKRAKWIALGVLLILAGAMFTQTASFRGLIIRLEGKKTLAQRLAQYGPTARDRIVPALKSKGIDYPPRQVILLALCAWLHQVHRNLPHSRRKWQARPEAAGMRYAGA